MKDKDAKAILKTSADYYLRKRGVMGEHWTEWRAVEHVLKKWERSDRRLAHARKALRELLEKWKDDARNGRGTTLGVSDRINKLLKELR